MKKKQQLTTTAKIERKDGVDLEFYSVATAAEGPVSAIRRDVAGSIIRTDRFKNIEDGMVPFRNQSSIYGYNKSNIDIRDAVVLCQKCYYNFAIFRNIIDLMTEFSVGEIYYTGGSDKSRSFFKAMDEKLNMMDFQDKFFREYFRSGNVFAYRFDAQIQPEDVAKISQTFGAVPPMGQLDNNKNLVPAKYIILNPADIQLAGSANFGAGLYYKVLTKFELLRLKNPQTDDDRAMFNSMPPQIQKEIQAGLMSVMIPLDINKVTTVFYKKQDYEPFAVPMGYPVLEDINFKAELRKIDMAISRTMQQIVLLVTTGTEPEKGGINQQNLAGLRKLFENQSVGRVLIADYTTEADWKIPAIGDLLNPQKYQIVNEDINIGLNNIFAGDEKFANQQQKVELFVARLAHARRAYIDNFWLPEIRKISKSLGFKSYPTPKFKDMTLKDNTNLQRLYAQLIGLGVLTPEQGFNAIKDNTLPDSTTFISDQREYTEQRNEGLFQPLLNQKGGPGQGGAGAGSTPAGGRPTGTGTPQTTKTIAPIGTSKAEQQYSTVKLRDNFILAQEVEGEIIKELKKINKVKELNDQQKALATEISQAIFVNEEKDNWKTSVKSYAKDWTDKNPKRVGQIMSFAADFNIDDLHHAAMLYHAKK